MTLSKGNLLAKIRYVEGKVTLVEGEEQHIFEVLALPYGTTFSDVNYKPIVNATLYCVE